VRSIPDRPTLRSIVPLGAVPDQLRGAVARDLESRGRAWTEVTFAGTALLPPGHRSRLQTRTEEIWVFALHAEQLDLGDELHAAGGEGFVVSVARLPDGLIPSVGYRALVYDHLAGASLSSEMPDPSTGLPDLNDLNHPS